MLFYKINQTVIRRQNSHIPESNACGGYLPDPVRLLRNNSIRIQRETSNAG